MKPFSDTEPSQARGRLCEEQEIRLPGTLLLSDNPIIVLHLYQVSL